MNDDSQNNKIPLRTSYFVHPFHYLTQDLPDISHQELIETACATGIRWVQLRVKNKQFDEWLQIAKEARSITGKYHAILIINDNAEIAKLADADGVHLGKQDVPVKTARNILGVDKIIGGTANSLQDIISLQGQGVNYIGLGPYRFTSTKENLSPVLGIEGYKKFEVRSSKFEVPFIAIGGIQIEDVPLLMQTGIYGIAVSSAINLAANKEQAIRQFLDQFSFTSK